jgi:hypothetical protein
MRKSFYSHFEEESLSPLVLIYKNSDIEVDWHRKI